MDKSRLEAFSDGVIAIIITIMVLELKTPSGPDLSHLMPFFPAFFSYLLSFIYVGIYWNNHHHLMQAAEKVSGPVLWANLHLLFWLSLIPFFTTWLNSANPQALPWPVAGYGAILLLAAIAYAILSRVLVVLHGRDARISIAIGRDRKGKVSILLYLAGISLSFLNPTFAYAVYIGVAILWLVPDRRIERVIS